MRLCQKVWLQYVGSAVAELKARQSLQNPVYYLLPLLSQSDMKWWMVANVLPILAVRVQQLLGGKWFANINIVSPCDFR